MRRSFTTPSARRASRFLPGLEALEHRCCLSAAGIVPTGHALLIHGDGANDVISVRDNGQGDVSASITLAGGTKTVSASGITSIQIEGGGGNDKISYALTGALRENESLMLCLDKGSSQAALDYSAGLSSAALAISVGGAGTGSNQLLTRFGALTGSRVHLTEGLGAGGATSFVNFGGALSGSLVTVEVDGGTGNDHVFAHVGNVSSSNLQFIAHLGNGANSFDLEEAGNLQNAVVHFDVDAGAGADTITFNARGVNVDATSRLNLETCSGAGADQVTLNYFGQLNGELDVSLQGGAGNDTMSASLTLEQGSTGRVRAQMFGGQGDGTMSLDVYDNSNPGGKSTLSLLQAVLDGGPGHNALSATPNVKVVK